MTTNLDGLMRLINDRIRAEMQQLAVRRPTATEVIEQARPAAYRALLNATDGIVRQVVELHGPHPEYVWRDGTVSWECRGCDGSGYDWEPPNWPCETSELIAERVGVSLREADYTVEETPA